MIDFADIQIACTRPDRMSFITDWVEHTPFAFAVMQWHRPNLLVELGTRTGVSYSTFCQAVQQISLPTRCYAVDTWKGDNHAGYYEEEIFREFNAYHEAHFKAFSMLLRMAFDEALVYFSDGSVDLLHIDGCHYYDAVKHDFESWLPKMSSRGVVMFHDNSIRDQDYGVWRLIEDLRQQYPVFEFLHGFGLAVVGVGSEIDDSRIQALFRASLDETISIRNFFSRMGGLVKAEQKNVTDDQRINELLKTIETKDHQISELEVKIRELKVWIDSMVNSASWKMTQPLRWLHGRVT